MNPFWGTVFFLTVYVPFLSNLESSRKYKLVRLISWCGNFPQADSLCRFLGDLSKNLQKLRVYKTFFHQEIRWKILHFMLWALTKIRIWKCDHNSLNLNLDISKGFCGTQSIWYVIYILIWLFWLKGLNFPEEISFITF